MLGFMRALHVRLATGDIGRNILRWSTVLMLISLASGLYLWWPRKRIRIRGPWWSRLFWSDQHNSFGIFSLLPLLLLTATGIVIGFEDEVSSLLERKPTGIRGSDVYRARIVRNADEAHALLIEMESARELTGRDEQPEGGGHITRIFVRQI